MDEKCICYGELPRAPAELVASIPDVRMGFCGPCTRAGCDGEAPCRVPPEFWDTSRYARVILSAWMDAQELERRWLQGELTNEIRAIERPEEVKSGTWVQVGDHYWRRETMIRIGTAISEVLEIKSLTGYHAQVRIPKPTALRFGGQAVGIAHHDLSSLETAKAECDKLIRELIAGGLSGQDRQVN